MIKRLIVSAQHQEGSLFPIIRTWSRARFRFSIFKDEAQRAGGPTPALSNPVCSILNELTAVILSIFCQLKVLYNTLFSLDYRKVTLYRFVAVTREQKIAGSLTSSKVSLTENAPRPSYKNNINFRNHQFELKLVYRSNDAYCYVYAASDLCIDLCNCRIDKLAVVHLGGWAA